VKHIIILTDVKHGKPVSLLQNNSLTYYNGRINMRYGNGTSPSLKFSFECNPHATGQKTVPTCEKKNASLYECHWQTKYSCLPLASVECSIRNGNGGSSDEQYDYTLLSKSERNWRARITGPNLEGVVYFINVCRTVVLQDAPKCPPTAGVCMSKG